MQNLLNSSGERRIHLGCSIITADQSDVQDWDQLYNQIYVCNRSDRQRAGQRKAARTRRRTARRLKPKCSAPIHTFTLVNLYSRGPYNAATASFRTSGPAPAAHAGPVREPGARFRAGGVRPDHQRPHRSVARIACPTFQQYSCGQSKRRMLPLARTYLYMQSFAESCAAGRWH